MKKLPTVYILASDHVGTLYIGVTSKPNQRIWQHKNGLISGFTKKYKVSRLVYYEIFDDMPSAINREKQLKKWNRAWKIKLIKQKNPHWNDLSNDFSGEE